MLTNVNCIVNFEHVIAGLVCYLDLEFFENKTLNKFPTFHFLLMLTNIQTL